MRRLTLLVALSLLLAGAALAASDGIELDLHDQHPHEVLAGLLAPQGLRIELVGEPNAPLSTRARAASLDALVRTLARRAGYLVSRREDRYLLYGDGADAELGGAALTIEHPLREIRVENALEHLGQFEGVQASVLAERNALLLRGTLDELRAAMNLLDAVDRAPPNVFLELLVVEYYHGHAFTWKYDIVNAARQRASEASFAPGVGLLSGLYDFVADLPTSFRLNLQALVDNDNARVVTNPHVVVRAGQSGQIDFKEELHIVLTNESANAGVTRTLETLEAGVKLEVLPRLGGAGKVQLDLGAEVAVFVPASSGAYAIDRHQLKTSVLLDDSQTLILGGLVKKVDVDGSSGVPGLRRIPLLGALFRSRRREDSYIETVIYVTPHLDQPDVFLPENIGKDAEEASRATKERHRQRQQAR